MISLTRNSTSSISFVPTPSLKSVSLYVTWENVYSFPGKYISKETLRAELGRLCLHDTKSSGLAAG